MSDFIEVFNARAIWTNFSGKEGRYNAAGERFFTLVIEDPDLAGDLLTNGWNVKQFSNQEEGDPPAWHLKVKVRFDSKYPPRIYMINKDGTGKVPLYEDTVEALDSYRIDSCDVRVNGSPWSTSVGSGVAAYLDTMYVVVHLNKLDLKWRDVEAASAIGLEEED